MTTPIEPAGTRTSEALMVLAYAELRALARRRLAREAGGHILEPTALVHEAFLRLHDADRVPWNGRTHFLAVAARQMRRVLVEHARSAGTVKRGGRRERVSLADHHGAVAGASIDLLAVDESLERIAARFPRSAEVAEMRIFSGMDVGEIARALGVSGRTVKNDWRFARAWLTRDLREGTGGEP